MQASQEAAETSSPSPPSPPSQAEQLTRDFNDRVRAGLEKAGAKSARDEVLDSEVLEEAPPPDPKAKSSRSVARASSTEKDGAQPAKEPASATSPGGKTAEEAERERPQPRYDSKSFTTWISNNPDKAAELAAKVFKVQLGDRPEEWKKSFISLENRRRRDSEQNEAELSTIQTQRAEVERLAKEAREPIEDVISLIEAETKEEYPAIDRFIETTFKMPFDEYCRRRLRGMGKETVTERALKQKITALEKKLEKEAPAAAPEERAPAVSAKWVEREIGAEHGVRDLGDWQKRVIEVYEASKDDDSGDYDMSIEDAADKVLGDFLKKRTTPGSPPPRERERRTQQRREPARQERRPAKVWTDDDEDGERTPAGDLDDAAPDPLDAAARQRWAMNRAARRAG